MAVGVAEIGGRGKAELRRHLFYAERPVRLQETPCRVHLEVVYVALRTHSELLAKHLADGDMRKADVRHYVRRRERAVKRRVDEAKRLREPVGGNVVPKGGGALDQLAWADAVCRMDLGLGLLADDCREYAGGGVSYFVRAWIDTGYRCVGECAKLAVVVNAKKKHV